MELNNEENQPLKFVCTRRTLVNIILVSTLSNFDEKSKEVESFLIKNTGSRENNDSEIKKIVKILKSEFKTKWRQSNRTKSIFLAKESKWLDSKIECCKHSVKRAVGRPIGDFESSSEQVKRKRTAGLRASTSTSELLFATQMKLRADGLKDTADLLTNLSNSSCDKEDTTQQITLDPITPLQALSMLIEANLTRQQYEVIRSYAKPIFPSYKMLQKEKQNAYPEGVTVTETEATVPLQSLVDNTAEKIIQAQKSVFESYGAAELTMSYKWGFDGSSGHSQYHQSYLTEKSGDDKFVFIACLVPLQLISADNRIYWKNEHPSSSILCRPIKLTFERESDSLVETVTQCIDQQIKNLTKTIVKLDGYEYKIIHKLIFSMIDGKLCNSLSDTKSALRCYLCKATSKDFNNIDKMMQLPIVEDYLSFGMSVLHAWIRMFECLLHISYKLEVKEWRSNKKIENKINENKIRIQNLFKEKMGLIVDKPKPGYGNTNTGNVARRFFQNAELSAEITGIDRNILHRFYIIFQCMSSGFPVDTEKFKIYCQETARLFISIYPWYYMSTTVHKILIHGHDIIAKSLLPIGQLSEEALEARNKDFKDYRQYFSRKTSRKDTITDIFNRMLISSDPLLRSIQSLSLKKKRHNFHKDAIEMFKNVSFEEERSQQS